MRRYIERNFQCNVQQWVNENYKIPMKNSKCAIQNGRPARYGIVGEAKKTHTKHPTPSPKEDTLS